MDRFEFVQIPVAIVLGFGISEILSGWGYQLRHRGRQHVSALQIVASAYVLLWSLRYLWIQWSSQPDTWDYAAYLLSVAPAVVLALAAHVIRFDPGLDLGSAEDGYERARRPTCALLALVPVLQVLRLAYVFEPQPSDTLLVGAELIGGLLLMSGMFAWLAATPDPRAQRIAWTVIWLVMLLFAASIGQDLGPSTR